MQLTKRGANYWVDFRLPDGKRVRRSTQTADRAEADRVAARIVTESMQGASAASADRPTTLEQALNERYENHWRGTKSDAVMWRTIGVINRDLGAWPLESVDFDRLEEYGKDLKRAGKAPGTINRRMSAIGVALGHAADKGWIARRPKLPKYEEPPATERYMTEAEEVVVFNWLKRRAQAEAYGMAGTGGWLYVRSFATVLLDTGLRFSEVFKAQLVGTELDLTNRDSKGRRGRRVPLTKRALASWMILTSMPRHQEFQAMRGKAPWDWINHRWRQATEANGCPDIGLHILRHTCASRLIQRGVGIYDVSKWLGHSSVKVTERYAKLAPDSLMVALAALERGETLQ
jgi:integrase